MLTDAGLRFKAAAPDVDEVKIMNDAFASGADTAAALTEIALAKASTVSTEGGETLVIAADSMLEHSGELLGKPADKADVISRWRRFAGTSGLLMTAHVVRRLPGGATVTSVETSQINFAPITELEIEKYASNIEPLMAAGAFTLEGLGSAFVTSIDGSASNVQGLSVPLLRRMTKELGIEWVDLWQAQPDSLD